MRRPSPLLLERSTRHGLAARTPASPLAATALTTAVQAQDAPASHLGLRARATGFTEDAVRHAIEVERSVVRTWLLRSTIHLVPAVDLPWLVRLIGPSVVRRYTTRWTELGLTGAVRDRVVDELPAILAGGPRSRAQILAELADWGVGDAELHPHALVAASTTGLICRGPDLGRASTFVLTEHWRPNLPPGPSGDDALAELARRYFRAYSPATPADFTSWSGLPASRAVRLIRDELAEADVDGRPGFRLGEVDPQRGIRLLPAFDNYVLGYADRSALIDRGHYGAVYQGGMIKPTIVSDGRIIGTWALRRAAGTLVVTPFEALTARSRRDVEREVADVGRFVGAELTPDFDLG